MRYFIFQIFTGSLHADSGRKQNAPSSVVVHCEEIFAGLILCSLKKKRYKGQIRTVLILEAGGRPCLRKKLGSSRESSRRLTANGFNQQ